VQAVADKNAGQTQVAWALITEGVAQARLDAYRLRHLVSRALKLVENSEAKEHLYEVAGDILTVAPRRLEALEATLDRLTYALSVLGTDHLRERLPMEDRAVVDDAVHQTRPFLASRVAYRYLMKKAGESCPDND